MVKTTNQTTYIYIYIFDQRSKIVVIVEVLVKKLLVIQGALCVLPCSKVLQLSLACDGLPVAWACPGWTDGSAMVSAMG